MADYTGGFSGAMDQASQARARLANEEYMRTLGMQAIFNMARQMQARRAGGLGFEALAGTMGQMPPPPAGTAAGGPQPPMPGTDSRAQMPPPPPPPAQAMAPTPVSAPMAPPAPRPQPPNNMDGRDMRLQQMRSGIAPGLPSAAVPAPEPVIPPFRPMPQGPAPVAQAGPEAGIPAPPAAAAPVLPAPLEQPKPERTVVSLRDVIQNLNKGQGTPEEKMEALEALRPVLNQQQQAELKLFQVEVSALRAANEAYRREKEIDIKRDDLDRKTRQGDERTAVREREAAVKEARLKGALAGAVGGAGNLKNTEYIYPRKDDGTIDQTQPPIGIRGTTKSGKIVHLDAEGAPTTGAALAGGTANDNKPPKAGAGFKLPAKAMQDIVGREKIMYMFDDLIKRQEAAIKQGKGFGGYVFDKAGDVILKAGRALGEGNPDEINFFADLETIAQPDRHALFGATLTGNELRSWREGWVGKGDNPQVMLDVLKSKRRAYDMMLKATRAGYERFAKGGAVDSSPQVPGEEPLDYRPPAAGGGASKSYPTEAAAQAAERAGTLRKGERVKIGNQNGTWR